MSNFYFPILSQKALSDVFDEAWKKSLPREKLPINLKQEICHSFRLRIDQYVNTRATRTKRLAQEVVCYCTYAKCIIGEKFNRIYGDRFSNKFCRLIIEYCLTEKLIKKDNFKEFRRTIEAERNAKPRWSH